MNSCKYSQYLSIIQYSYSEVEAREEDEIIEVLK